MKHIGMIRYFIPKLSLETEKAVMSNHIEVPAQDTVFTLRK
jgi:hypothetical protein